MLPFPNNRALPDMSKSTRTLTFSEFFLALAWALENIDQTVPEEERPLVENGRISAVFLPPAWELGVYWSHFHYGNFLCQRDRAAELTGFLYSCFFRPRETVDLGVLKSVSNEFVLRTSPPAHIELLPDSKAGARSLFRVDPRSIQIAVGEVLRRYLDHRREDRDESGQMSCTGFGLALRLKIPD